MKAVDALRKYVAYRQEKKQKEQQAVLFCEIWNKTKVLRALAMHNLEIQ